MKITKQVALLAVLAVSILPGCGKKNDKQDSVSTIPGYQLPGGLLPGGQSPAATFSASGSLSASQYNGYIYGNLASNGSGTLPGGPTYQKSNIAGDQIVLTVAGQAPSLTGYAIVYLTSATMNYLQVRGCGMPTLVSFNGTTLVPGNPGTMNIGISVGNGNWNCQINF